MTHPYADGRPSATKRLESKDHGVVLRHSDVFDKYGARDVWVFEHNGTFYMHYDAAGESGWLAALATSKDGIQWQKHGPILELGEAGEADSASASYGVTFFDGEVWHLFYLGTPNVTNPGKVPAFPYQTLKAKASAPSGPWVKQAVMPIASVAGTFYSHTSSPGHVIKQGNEYLMFFSAAIHGSEGTKRTLGLARTRDLNAAWTVDSAPILPLTEQIENSSLYFEASTGTWFLFTNHVGIRDGEEYTDAVWVYWSDDVTRWNPANKAVVLDAQNCSWSANIVGLPSVLKIGNRLALYYDGYTGNDLWHTGRDVGLAWLELPLMPPT